MLAFVKRPSVARIVVAANLSMFLLTVIVAAVLLTSQNRLKVHGPLYEQIKSSNDLTADILPPPLYLIEIYLTVMEASSGKGTTDRQSLVGRLDQLEKDFNDRRTYWSTQNLPSEIRTLLDTRVHSRRAGDIDGSEEPVRACAA